MLSNSPLIPRAAIFIHRIVKSIALFPWRLYCYVVEYYKNFVISDSDGPNFTEIVNAVDIKEICKYHGYDAQDYVVQTEDCYLLTVHRISRVGDKPNGPVVYFHHGLLTNSELFVLGDTASRCLPFLLVERGYDVWLGNNRGNKYSRKHINLNCASPKFWDFSIDEFAIFDIPDTIEFILSVTSHSELTYIGFSQGCSQLFAALSMFPELNNEINLMVGLSPVLIPQNLPSPLGLALIKFPKVLYYVLGKKAVLPSVIALSAMILGPLYRIIVDQSVKIIFNWKTKNISNVQKQVGYPHLFSPSSVKSVVHWLQIIASDRFQMFDDVKHSTMSKLSSSCFKLHKVTPFPVETITTEVFLVYGKSDILIKIKSMEDGLKNCKKIEKLGIDSYEHMDILWAKDVEEMVFKPVIEKIMSLKTTHVDATPAKAGAQYKFIKIDGLEESNFKIDQCVETSIDLNDMEESLNNSESPYSQESLFV